MIVDTANDGGKREKTAPACHMWPRRILQALWSKIMPNKAITEGQNKNSLLVRSAPLYLQKSCTPVSSLPGRSTLRLAARGLLFVIFMCRATAHDFFTISEDIKELT